MAKKTQKLFYVRIDFVDLLDFATDPIGNKMSLLSFAKELMKEQSEIPQIQRIINEAHCYISQKKEAGRESARRRQEEKERLKAESTALNGAATTLNDVGTTLERCSTDPQRTSTNNRSNSILPNTIQGEIDIPVGVVAGMEEVITEHGEIVPF